MAEYIARVATTAVLDRGGVQVKITKEAIESMAIPADSGRALPLDVEHDLSCMPIGKITEIWTEPFGQEHAAMARIYIEEGARRVTHRKSSTDLVYLSFTDAPKPFARTPRDPQSNSFAMSIDRANFRDAKSYEAFLDSVKRIDEQITYREVSRHSLIPEPIIEFLLSDPRITAAFATVVWGLIRAEKFIRQTVDKTLEKAANLIAEQLHAKIKKVVKAYNERKTDDDRPVLVAIALPSDSMDVILLAKVSRNEHFPDMNLQSLAAEMKKYGDVLRKAEEAAFLWTDTGWKFQYLKTCTGEVLGTYECYNTTIERMAHAKNARVRSNKEPTGEQRSHP